MKDVSRILNNVISPFEQHCSGSGIEPANCYVTTPLIATGVAPIECSHSGSDMLDKIIAFDRAEASEANITQTNMITVSSFNGVNGAILGYDFLKADLQPHHLLDRDKYPNAYDAQPLFETTKALYGTVSEKHFPILPGQHILCAYKSMYKYGPCIIYGALGIAIAAERDKNADLYMEDHGTIVATRDDLADNEQQEIVLENLIRSIQHVSENLGVKYEKILVGFKSRPVRAGEVGCVITAAPYIHLAKSAIPEEGPERLETMGLQEWTERNFSKFLKA